MKKADRIALQRARAKQNREGRAFNKVRPVFNRLTQPAPVRAPDRPMTSRDMADAMRYAMYGVHIRNNISIGKITSA
jgi:hypothetical protein